MHVRSNKSFRPTRYSALRALALTAELVRQAAESALSPFRGVEQDRKKMLVCFRTVGTNAKMNNVKTVKSGDSR
jgi:hypothetical protein